MGQKINPISLRLQTTNRSFDSCWYSDFYYSDLINQNLRIQEYLNSILKQIQYPEGRFFIQESQKKTKIFFFFYSPLKSRKIKSNFFKLNYSKNTNKRQNNKNLTFDTALLFKKPSFFDLSINNLFLNDIPKNTISKKLDNSSLFNAHQKNEKNFRILKYYIYSKYLWNLFGNNKKNTIIDVPFKAINKKIKISQNKVKNILFLKKRINDFSISQDQNVSFGTEKKEQLNTFLQNITVRVVQQSCANQLMEKSGKSHLVPLIPLSKTTQALKFVQQSCTKPLYDNNLTFRKHFEYVLTQNFSVKFDLYPIKIKDYYQSAVFLAEEIVYLLERRIPFRRIKNKILKEIQHINIIKGIRITCSGRVGGRSKKAQRAKLECVKFGQTSLHVFSSPIDFASKKALTPFGLVGIKVWICFKD